MTMDYIQTILAYITLAWAVGYLVWKFLLPKHLFTTKKGSSIDCGDGNCGCN